MRALRFVWVGRVKEPFFRDAAAHYMQAAGRYFSLSESLIKDAPGKLPEDKRVALEGERILAALGEADTPIVLDVKGKTQSSEQFAALLERLTEDANRTPAFIIGGPFGLSRGVLSRAAHKVSLGPMTLPHELARVVLLEQVYRASQILQGSPYHHA